MATVETNARSSRQETSPVPRRETFVRTSGYLIWLSVWAVVAEIMLVAGVMLLSWGLKNVGAREGALAFSTVLIVFGCGMLAFTSIVVWMKAGADEEMERLRQAQRSQLRVTDWRAS